MAAPIRSCISILSSAGCDVCRRFLPHCPQVLPLHAHVLLVPLFLPKLEQAIKLGEGVALIRDVLGLQHSGPIDHPFRDCMDPAAANPLCLALTTPLASARCNYERLEFLGFATQLCCRKSRAAAMPFWAWL